MESKVVENLRESQGKKKTLKKHWGAAVQEEDVDVHLSAGEEGEMIESSNHKELGLVKGNPEMEPHVGMEFESEEAAKAFYEAYATQVGFIMRVDAFRRSTRDGTVVWRRLVCNKEGFRKFRPKRCESRKPRAITREGCKAMIVVKKEKTGKWVVSKIVKEHNHPLVGSSANIRRTAVISQTPDEKDVNIRELTAELQRERRRSAALQEQLEIVLKDMEEHSKHISRNIDDIVQSVREIESKRPMTIKNHNKDDKSSGDNGNHGNGGKESSITATRKLPQPKLNDINHRKHQEENACDGCNHREYQHTNSHNLLDGVS
ncbi:FAR1 DNA binding domain [Dillenia turbinata]|uniref:FAR1 DNA binding domain n=1 Tax=Dillenia turbinata TaxID=194707 RepID=A0AAN8VUE6_9MAGN